MSPENISSNYADEPTTVLVLRRPLKDKVTEFEQALSGAIAAALKVPSHLGVTVLKPQNGQHGDYRLVVKFNSRENFRRWKMSLEADHWFEALSPLEEKPPNLEIVKEPGWLHRRHSTFHVGLYGGTWVNAVKHHALAVAELMRLSPNKRKYY